MALYQRKDLTTRNMHVKYESSITYHSKFMATIKVYCRQKDRVGVGGEPKPHPQSINVGHKKQGKIKEPSYDTKCWQIREVLSEKFLWTEPIKSKQFILTMQYLP